MIEPSHKNRYGRFKITHALIERDPAAAVAALEGCIVVRAESMFAEAAVEYFAMHPDFDVVDAGSMTPRYEAVISGGKRTWRRSL